MDVLLQKVTQQAMTYAIRSGIAITSSYAISQCSRLVKTVKSEEKDELTQLQHRLDAKIRIIAPAINMIELIAARGNTSLESAVSLTKSIRFDFQSLGLRLSKAAANEEAAKQGNVKAKTAEQLTHEVKQIIKDIKGLLNSLEDAVPLINLAISTSGVTLSSSLPPTVSPSRLLQASTFLSAGDSRYSTAPAKSTQIGPRFTVSLYMLFLGHANQALDEEGLEKVVWKEVIHKAQVKILRVSIDQLEDFPFILPTQSQSKFGNATFNEQHEEQMPGEAPSAEFAYQLTIIEDLEDGRMHEDEAEPAPVDDVAKAGIRTHIPIHQIAKIFYADTGKILNLGSDSEANNPILLLRRDPKAPAPRRMMQNDDFSEDFRTSTHQQNTRASRSPWSLPLGLDPEWVALEVFKEGQDSDEESDVEADSSSPSSPPAEPVRDSKRGSLASAFSNLRLASSRKCSSSPVPTISNGTHVAGHVPRQHSLLGMNGPIMTSLSLLEMLIRLTSLQQFQQSSHLAITDELLNFFLSEGSTTGAASGDAESRKRIRMEARQHVGFDPYDESPIKRRGEAYQHLEGDPDYPGVPADEESLSSSTPGSPLVYRSQEPSSPRFSSGRHSPRRQTSSLHASPPLPARAGTRSKTEPPLPITPPGTSGLNERFLRNGLGSTGSQAVRSSPLARATSGDQHDPHSEQ